MVEGGGNIPEDILGHVSLSTWDRMKGTLKKKVLLNHMEIVTFV